MSSLTYAERACFERLLGMQGGYVLDFSNRTLSDFFNETVGVNIYDKSFEELGTSKANRLRSFWKRADDRQVARVLLPLIELATTLESITVEDSCVQQCRDAVQRLSAVETSEEAFHVLNQGDAAMRCFVVQPFDDGGEYDRRYEQVIEPAIASAGLDSYRVDRDPSTTVIIEAIEEQIANAAVVLADITLDNPNVWYELGYARAIGKEIVIICSDDRPRLPFDIQHRAVLKYRLGSPSDFERLQADITDRLRAAIEKSKQLTQIDELVTMTSDAKGEGLRPYEVAALAVIAAQTLGPASVASGSDVGDSMEKQGYNGTASALALRSLQAQGLLEVREYTEEDWNNSYTYEGYALTDSGVMWLREHESLLELHAAPKQPVQPAKPDTFEDDIPF